MKLPLEPNIGAGPFRFGTSREEIRAFLPGVPSVKKAEPENDFYEHEGLILGFDGENALEFIEIIPPSIASYDDLDLFQASLSECLDRMKKNGHIALFKDGSYDFGKIGIIFYCPAGELESVSVYKRGYYDNS